METKFWKPPPTFRNSCFGNVHFMLCRDHRVLHVCPVVGVLEVFWALSVSRHSLQGGRLLLKLGQRQWSSESACGQQGSGLGLSGHRCSSGPFKTHILPWYLPGASASGVWSYCLYEVWYWRRQHRAAVNHREEAAMARGPGLRMQPVLWCTDSWMQSSNSSLEVPERLQQPVICLS